MRLADKTLIAIYSQAHGDHGFFALAEDCIDVLAAPEGAGDATLLVEHEQAARIGVIAALLEINSSLCKLGRDVHQLGEALSEASTVD